MQQLDYVSSQVERETKFFRKKRNYNRAMSLIFVCAAAVLSALATVSLGAAKMLTDPGWKLSHWSQLASDCDWGYCSPNLTSQIMAH